MEDSIRVSGTRKLESAMDLEFNFGQTAPNMKDFGLMIKRMARDA
jgi:hypothetical protein